MQSSQEFQIRRSQYPAVQENWSPPSDSFSEFFASDSYSQPQFESTAQYADYSHFGLYPENMEGDEDWESLQEMGIDVLDSVRLAFPEMGEMDDSMLEAELETMFSTMSEADIEGFWNWVKKKARKVAKVAARVIKPVLKTAGGAVGTFFGGPAGAALGSKIGGAIGGLASRGLTMVSQGKGKQVIQQVRRNVQQAATRVRQGKPVFNNSQVANALAQLQALLSNPQLQGLLGRRESMRNAAVISGEAADAALMEIAYDIIETANVLEQALHESNAAYEMAYDESWAS